LQDYGFQAIVAPSFADIFYSNCTKIGLLPVVLSPEDCRALARAGEGEIDLGEQEVRFEGREVAFEIDHEIRRRLLEGLDDIGVTLGEEAEIAAYEAARERRGPITTAL
jgi:3-isopropylmalate/(R)-2-methylmalate dehydratase small subunit